MDTTVNIKLQYLNNIDCSGETKIKFIESLTAICRETFKEFKKENGFY